VRCVTLTNYAELMQRQYNEELKGGMNHEDCLAIVNDLSILACTKLGKTTCKCVPLAYSDIANMLFSLQGPNDGDCRLYQ